MAYHIDTGLIKEKFKTNCECPLCEIKAIVEEQLLHEFLNDAVMEETTRLKVNQLGFCSDHFDKLFARQNKLSLALQVYTRVETLQRVIEKASTLKGGLKQAEKLVSEQSTCIICDYLEESMVKYYKTIAQMYEKEEDFYKTLCTTKGFCIDHYVALLKYAKYAGKFANEYVAMLTDVERRNFSRLQQELKGFCDKHDYRNAMTPLGSSETALPRMGQKLYGKKDLLKK